MLIAATPIRPTLGEMGRTACVGVDMVKGLLRGIFAAWCVGILAGLFLLAVILEALLQHFALVKREWTAEFAYYDLRKRLRKKG